MKTTIKSICLLGLIISLCLVARAGQTQDVVFKAMQDELARNISELKMPGLEQPYFISYTIDDFQNLTVKGTLGTLTQSKMDRVRYLTTDLRVGDNTLDNSNFVAGYYDPGPSLDRLSIDDDYDAIRNQIFLSTDDLYKNALKEISKKRAYLQTRVIKDRPADFLKQTANTSIGPTETFDIDKPYFEQLALVSTKVFRDYPEIFSSTITIQAAVNNQYYTNSAGSKSIRGDRTYVIELSMSGRSAEGDNIFDGDRIIVKDLKGLPGNEKLAEWAKGNADRMRKIIAAKAEDEYAGPVIFTDDAGGEFFRQLFVKNISENPAPYYEREELEKQSKGPELANKVKRQVLPAFINIYDDPTVASLDGFRLVGDFTVDDAGNAPKKIVLVENGKLVNLPIGIAPTKLVKESNGHARGAVGKEVKARPGNIVIESSDKVPFDKLKESMLQMCKDMGLDYGVIVRKLENPDGQSESPNYYYFGQQNENALSTPLEAYKVYQDGKEELMRGMEFSGVTVRSLKDILQTGDKEYGYNYLIKNDNEMPVSIVSPSILVEEMELKKSEAKTQQPILLPSPLAKK